MQVLFVGTTSAFSLPVLQALIESAHEVVGVTVPDKSAVQFHPPPKPAALPVLPSSHNDTIIASAWIHGIPVMGLQAARPVDVIAVACYPQRLPAKFLRLARRAALNIHPSWLPDYRGPVPLFWQLRDGVTDPGITLHHMTDELDRGSIVAQTRLALPEGISGPQADRVLAAAGAGLLLEALEQDDFEATPQTGAGSYHSWPRAADWEVPTTWPVRKAYNFLRGTAEWNHPYTLLTQRGPLSVRTTTGYTETATEPGVVRDEPAGWAVSFADGWLLVR